VKRTLAATVTVVVVLLAPAAAQAASDHVVVTGGLTQPAGATAHDVVVLDGPVRIAGHVTGDVFAAHGSVTVAGTVDGDVTSISRRVTLAPGARVGGDLLYGGPKPAIAPSAHVAGKVSDEGWTDISTTGVEWALRLAFWLAVTVSTLALGLALIALFPRPAEAAWVVARERTGVAAAWAAGLFFGLPLVAAFAVATLLGLPFGIGLGLALVPLAMVGYVTSCLIAGGVVMRRTGETFKAFLVGWLILRLLALVPGFGVLVWFVASAFGLGVLFVAAWYASRRPMAPPRAVPA
jgi:cytoskeletal protein CcmA (bactofilin family)